MNIYRDIGYLTEDGYVQVIGRLKDMVIRGGENIYPKEIEDVLIAHPKISEAYVSKNESWPPDNKH